MIRLGKILVAASIIIAGVGAAVIPQRAFATEVFGCDDPAIPEEAKEAMGCGKSEEAFPTALRVILESVIGVGAVVAVAYIIVGGVKYMTAEGDAGKVKVAKNTILYALIGLVIAALAFALVNWAIDIINKSDGKSGEGTALIMPSQS